jgi:hypothetical protein
MNLYALFEVVLGLLQTDRRGEADVHIFAALVAKLPKNGHVPKV